MALSTDFRIREQYGSGAAARGTAAAVSEESFSQVFSSACQSATKYERYFQSAANAYQVPADLLKAVAKVESDFTANAVSRCGAQGVMQLMPATARSLGVTNSFDPAQNIMGGAKYLRQMLDRFDGDVSLALAAYNSGPGAVEKSGGVPQKSRNYVDKVLGYAGEGASAPARTASAPTRSVSTETSELLEGAFTPVNALTRDELTELIYQVCRSGGSQNQEYMRLLVQQIFLQNNDDDVWAI